VSLTVEDGDVLALVGANGAGKTTLLRTIAGAHPATSGRVIFDGLDITRSASHQRVARGIALVPEGRKLFAELTVEENLLVAGGRARPGPWNLNTVLAAFPMLQPLRRQRASTLSGGEQQATAIARALMTNPRLLLVDEVSLGLSPQAVETVYGSLRALIRDGATVVLVEQDLSRALSVAGRVVCLLEGRVVLSSATSGVTREQVTEAYFGLSRTGSGGSA
jgi:branched-chain amino acid transport system ATP-binding protein